MVGSCGGDVGAGGELEVEEVLLLGED